MKKILLIIITSFLFLTIAYAEESLDISSNIKIKYKWYKEEIIDSKYYQINSVLDGYIEDKKNISYGNFSNYNENNCFLSRANYEAEYKPIYKYNLIIDTKTIKLSGISQDKIKEIKIYSNMSELEYIINSSTNNSVIISLNNFISTSDIWFYIDTDYEYDITLGTDTTFSWITLYKHVSNHEKVLIPDKTWIVSESHYVNNTDTTSLNDTYFRTMISKNYLCRVRPILTYRYKLEKKYYDDEYHEYVEGYLPDINDYIIEYTGAIPTKTVEITKTEIETIIKKIPETKYVYLENEEQVENIDEEIEENKCEKEIETKYITNNVVKEVKQTPKKIYYVISILSIITILEFIIIKKSRLK